MAKKTIRLTEQQLRQVVKESVIKILKETDFSNDDFSDDDKKFIKDFFGTDIDEYRRQHNDREVPDEYSDCDYDPSWNDADYITDTDLYHGSHSF